MNAEQHLERASAELAAGDFASANTHALLGIGWLLLAQAPKPIQVSVYPSCESIGLDADGVPRLSPAICGCNLPCDRTCNSIDSGCPVHDPEGGR